MELKLPRCLVFWREFPFLVLYIVVDGVTERHIVLFCKEESFRRHVFWFTFSLKNKKKKSFAEEKHQMHPFNYLQYLLSYNLYVFFFSCPRDYVDLIKIERCLGGIRSCACGFLRGYWKRSDDSFQDRGRLPVEEWGSLVFM
jgi:hypothetical protein